MAAVLSCSHTAVDAHRVSSQGVHNMLLLPFLPQGLIPADLLGERGKQAEGVSWMHTTPLRQLLGLQLCCKYRGSMAM